MSILSQALKVVPAKALAKQLLGWVEPLNVALSVNPGDYPSTEAYKAALIARVDRVKAAPGTLRGYLIKGIKSTNDKESLRWGALGVCWLLEGLSSLAD